MKRLFLLVALPLLAPMAILNPFGRPAFIGCYAGVIAAWAGYMIAFTHNRTAVRQPSH